MASIHIPPDWRRAAGSILAQGARKVLVLGATDRGKSTFCHYLAWYFLQAGIQPALIDADVGQKDLGPPATLTLGYPKLNLALQDLKPAAWYFVGAVSPVAHLLPMVVGSRQLLDQAEAPVTIINTSGLVTGVGEVLKAYKIDGLRPDVLVAIERGQELSPILAAHRHFLTLRLRASPHARPKSWELRVQRRQAAFRAYFRNAREQALLLDELIVQRLPVDSTDPAVHLTENRLCGLADAGQRLLGLGLIRRFDAPRRRLCLFTPVNAGEIKVLQLGDLRLDWTG